MTTTMLSTAKPATGGQTVCFERVVTGGFRITLMQHPSRAYRSFSVQYGKQLDHDLTYDEACRKLGAALMHSLACEGRLDNDRDDFDAEDADGSPDQTAWLAAYSRG